MLDNIDREEYKKNHKGNLRTLFTIYWSNKPIWKSYYFWISVIIAVISQCVICITENSFYESIRYVSDKMLNIMPNILGFNLGGYVLLIGLNSQNILDEITEPVKPSKYSLFQKQSSVFAFSILIQAISILLGYIMIGIMELGTNIILPYYLARTINFLGFIILNIISLYALILIVQIVLNIFNFGQILHFFVRLDRLEKESDKKSD